MRRRFTTLRRQLALKSRFALRRVAGAVARRWRARGQRLPLEQVQRRLELQLVGMYGRPISIEPMASSRRVLDHLRGLVSRVRAGDGVPVIDGNTIKLPVSLAAPQGRVRALARYRLFAIEQAERIARDTVARASMHDPLERDLFLLREAATIDAAIARAHPGMIETLQQERRLALARRPSLDTLTAPEREVELILREALSRPAGEVDIAPDEPDATLEWARNTAARIHTAGARYRGVPPAPLWGALSTAAEPTTAQTQEHERSGPEVMSSIQAMTGPIGVLDMETRDQRASASDSKNGERDAEAGDPDAYASSKPSSAAGPHKHQDVTTQHEREPAQGEAGHPGPGLMGTTHRTAAEDSPDDLPPALWYDEWNSDRGVYVKRATAVRLYEPSERDDSETVSADEILRDHGALVRQIRHQFERLRARRTLLADTSGSTQTTVADSTRVIDLERIALLLAAEALDALGDLYAVYSFAGKSANNVKLTTLKRFDQRTDRTVRHRITHIAPGGFTRLGAAVRHTTRELARQSAGHRLLLILSDGRPNDIDAYQGTHGVEDSRQAIFEARASGVFPFCITVDADASEYLPRIFGTAGHVIVRRPAQLPSALLAVVSALIRRG